VNELEKAINTYLSQQRENVKPSSLRTYKITANQMLSLAKKQGFTCPCQQLYDAFVQDGKSSKGRLDYHLHLNRCIDLIAGTGAVDPNGELYNKPRYDLDPGYCEAVLPDTFPVPPGTSLATVILIAEKELKKVDISKYLYDLYRYEMQRAYEFSALNGVISYNDAMMTSYYLSLQERNKGGALPDWKWRLARKSVFMLRMTAQTGSFPWIKLTDDTQLDAPDLDELIFHKNLNGLEKAISQYLEEIRENLADATFKARLYLTHQMLRLASSMGVSEPCQELYDAFLSNPNNSSTRRAQHMELNREIDRIAGTHALRPDGFMYNDPPMPSYEQCQAKASSLTFPVPSGTDISLVMSIVESGFRGIHLSESTIGQHHRIFREIYQFFYLKGSTEFSNQVLNAYLSQMESEYKAGHTELWKWKIRRRTVLLMQTAAQEGKFKWVVIHHISPLKDSKLEDIRQRIIVQKRTANASESTVYLYDLVFRTFLSSAGIEEASQLSLLTHEALASILDKLSKRWCQNSASTLFPILQVILRQLMSMGYLENNLADAVMRVSVEKGAEPYYLDAKSEKRLYELLDTVCLRDRCIILIALELGLRESDIILLKFEEIDWEADQIHFIQKKTGKEITVPLLPDIGNALMDYILHERPNHCDDYPFVFLRKHAPHHHLTSAHRIIRRILDQNGIKPVGADHRGLHLLRHTLTMRMLESSVPHQQITDVLGHASPKADKSYISMEETMLRMCALSYGDIHAPAWQLEFERRKL